jgi:hypothetical protein
MRELAATRRWRHTSQRSGRNVLRSGTEPSGGCGAVFMPRSYAGPSRRVLMCIKGTMLLARSRSPVTSPAVAEIGAMHHADRPQMAYHPWCRLSEIISLPVRRAQKPLGATRAHPVGRAPPYKWELPYPYVHDVGGLRLTYAQIASRLGHGGGGWR